MKAIKPGTYLAIAALCTLAACGGTDADHRLEVTTEDGVRTVVNRGGPRFEESLFDFEHVLTLQQDEEVPASLLGSIQDIRQGGDGRFYVADARNVRIAVFGPDGIYQHDIGRYGKGPGEFDMRFHLEALRGDTLQVFDASLQRTTLFRTDGSLIGTVHSPLDASVDHMIQVEDDRLLMLDWQREMKGNISHQRPEAVLAGSSGDTLAWIRGPSIPQSRFTDLTGPDGRYAGRYTRLMFGGMPQLLFDSPDRILIAHGTEPVIDRYGLDGTHRLRVRIEVELPVMDRGFQDRYWQLADSIAAAQGQEPERMERVKERMMFADRLGFSERGFVDDRGYVWLLDQRAIPFMVPGDPASYHLVSPEGRYAGTVEVPGPFSRVFAVDDGLVLATTYDLATGVTEAVVYRLHPAVEGFDYLSGS
ncbi:MAG: 6-bladed beta-propeller [bacterium]